MIYRDREGKRGRLWIGGEGIEEFMFAFSSDILGIRKFCSAPPHSSTSPSKDTAI